MVMAQCLFGAKPLPEPTITWCEMDPRNNEFSRKKYENGIKILRCPFKKMHFKLEDMAPNDILIDCELALV